VKLRCLVSAIADLFWAPRCAGCDARLPGAEVDPERAAFCELCLASVDRALPPRCPRCGVSFEAGGADHLCGSCLADPPPFASLWAPYAYGGALAAAIARFKYGPAPWLAAPLGRLLAGALPPAQGVDLVVPVPLHPRRLRERGYNQAALLAAPLPRALGAPLDASILRRLVDTPHQAGRHGAERRAALAGAFRARSFRLAGARVLLVDDVATTGATVRAASSALLDGGARRVDVLCLARTM
jgi:ComF family protein